MSVLVNNKYSSQDIPLDAGYESLQRSKNGYFKKEHENINNNLQQSDYITLKKAKQDGHGEYLFWALVLLLFVLAAGNLILTFIILGVLRLGQGMESMELLSEERLIKFHGNIDLDRIYKHDGCLDSFSGSPMDVLADESAVTVTLSDTNHHPNPQLKVDVNQNTIKNVDTFEVKHPRTGKVIFSTNFPNFGLPQGVTKLNVKKALTRRLTSPVNESLVLRSDRYTVLKGSEGTLMDGKEVIWYADQDVYLKSVNKSIILNGREGVLVDVKSIPVAIGRSESAQSHSQYKLCVCMPQGKLFRVAIPSQMSGHVGCHTVDLSPHHNPCI